MTGATADSAVVVCRGNLDSLPPAMFVASRLRSYFARVTAVVSGCSPAAGKWLSAEGVELCVVNEGQGPGVSLAAKVVGACVFRQRAWGVIQKAARAPFLWVINPHSAIVLGRRLLQRPFVLQLLEFDDLGWRTPFLRPLAQAATAVVVPEQCRAALTRWRYSLTGTPYVFPNTPLVARRGKCLPISNGDARDGLAVLAPQTRIVIYQGIVRRDRDIRPLAALLHEMGPPWQLVVMGRDFGFLQDIQRVCPNLTYIPYISPPEHLEVTSHAFIGVLCYAFDCLNNLFCAPNKVGEYAAFGIPMLANDVPGLRLSVEASGAGVCCDFSRPDALRVGIESLATHYDSFAHSARVLYDKVRTEEALSAIVESAMDNRCVNECVSR